MSRVLLKFTERTALDKVLINGAIEKGEVYSADILNMLFNSKTKYGSDSFFEHFYRRTMECIKAQTKDATKKVCKYIPYLVTYFGFVTLEKKGVLPEEIEGLFYLKDKVTALLDKFEVENDISGFLETAQKVIEESYPEQFEKLTAIEKENPEQETSDGNEESQKLQEILEENGRLKKENTNLKAENQRIQQKLDKKAKEAAAIKQRKDALESEKRKRKSASKERQDKISDNNERMRQLRISLKEAESKNLSLQTEIEQKDADHEEDTRQLREIAEMYCCDQKSKNFKERIKEKLIELLIDNEYSVMNIMHVLSTAGYDVSKELILTCLNELETTFAIKKDSTYYPTTYRITKAAIDVDKTFKINSSSDGYFDTLLITDIHANLVELDRTQQGLDVAYNYATKKKIHLLTNLGDFIELNIPISKTMGYSDINDLRRLIDAVSEKMPRDKKIDHAILGGNHCEKLAECGINPIAILERTREDVIDLGYKRAFLSLGKAGSRERDKIALLHPNCRKNVSNDDTRSSKFTQKFNPKEYTRRNCYLSCMGHTHIGKFYDENGLYLIPSLTRDREQNGAVHMRVYFDIKGKIKSIVLLPLVNRNNRLEQDEDEKEYVRKR